MKLNAKKSLSAILAALLVTCSLAGCASGDKDSTKVDTPSKTESTAAGGDADKVNGVNKTGMPIVDEQITLDVLTVRWGSMGDTFTQNQWIKDLETRTNIKVEWQVQSANDWAEQKSILLASGTLPSVILGSETFKDADISNNVSYFMPLADLIDGYMPNLTAAFAANPELKKEVTSPDGNIYSMPRKLPARPIAQWQPSINKKWLDNLKLEVPTTMDELYTVLKAFKDEDANGNGDKNDEIPVTSKALELSMLSPYEYNDPIQTNVVMLDGKPAFYPTSTQYKEGIKYMQKMYADGILDQEMFTQDESMVTAKKQNADIAIVGFAYQWTPDATVAHQEEYIAIAPLKGPDGKAYSSGDPNGCMAIGRNELEITTFCKTPEAAARWADEFYTPEASVQNFWGAIGTVLQENADKTYELLPPPEGTSADAWYWDQSLRDFGPKYVPNDFSKNLKLPTDSGDGFKLEISKMAEEFVTVPFPNVMYTEDEFAELPTLTTDIDEFVLTTRAQWITKGGIDEGWDAYAKKLNDMGLEDLMKIRTDAYNRYIGG